SAKVTGVITRIMVDPSSHVQAGTVLARIDDGPYAIELERAKLNLERARANIAIRQMQVNLTKQSLERANSDFNSGSIPRAAVDAAQSNFETARGLLEVAKVDAGLAEVSIKKAQMDLDATSLRSPIDGLVINRRVKIGQLVSPSANDHGSLFLIGDMRRMQLRAPVKEEDIGKFRVGQTVQFKFPSFPGKVFKGAVVRITATRVHDESLFTLVCAFENGDGALMPYLTANAEFDIGKTDRVGR